MKTHTDLRFKMTLLITGLIFILLTLTMFVSNAVIIFSVKRGWIEGRPGPVLLPFLFQTGAISIVIGTALTFFLSHLPLRPLHTLMEAIHQVSQGNFDVKIHLEHPREFRELSRSFNQMTEELAGTQMLREDFVRNFSHEFKTPIVSILGVAKLLKNQKLDAAQSQEYLDIIIEESQRLSQLSATILNLSKIESLSLLTDKTVYCLSEQIREAILLLEHKWVKKQIEFEIHMEEMDIVANASLLKQVWVNLLDNAIKFSPVGESVFVTLQKDGADAVFAVRDNGPGMDEKTKPFIFDKFYQGDASHHQEGNGLGLPLVKKIVELHKGSVLMESQPQRGCRFTVRLPPL